MMALSGGASDRDDTEFSRRLKMGDGAHVGDAVLARRCEVSAASNGLSTEYAERVFQQIEGFGSYGFSESHAAAFAHLAYVSAYLKCHYPAEFAVALLNSQPMGSTARR